MDGTGGEKHTEDGHDRPCHYLAFHWMIWPRLVVTPGARDLDVEREASWEGLWGGIGAELFACFLSGDNNIRYDMILRAKQAGAVEGAAKLSRWKLTLE